MMNRICIVIPHYGDVTATEKCIQSLDGLDSDPLTIFVVDNSVGEGVSFVSGKHRLDVLRPEANLGFAGGCNMGIRHGLEVGCDGILLLNNDTTVQRNLVTELLAVLDDRGDAGIIAPKILMHSAPPRIESAGGRVSLWYGRSYLRGHGEEDRGQYDAVEQTAFCSGTAMLLRSDMLRSVGLLDEDFFMYHEDTDLCLRARQGGFELYYTGRTHVVHDTSLALGGYMNRSSFYYCSRNGFSLLRKHGSRLQKVFHAAYMFCVYPFALAGHAMLKMRADLVRVYPRVLGAYLSGKMSGPADLH